MGGVVVLVLGVTFSCIVVDDLTLHLCRRHHEKASLVVPAAFDPA